MQLVGIKILKNKLSEYVRRAAGGETVLITDRDQVVAELVPPQTDRRALSDAAFIAQAARDGWLTPAADAGAALPRRRPLMPLREVLAELARDRDGR